MPVGRGSKGVRQTVRLPARLWRGMSFEQFRDAVLKLDGTGGSLVLNNLFAAALVDRSTRFANSDPQTLDLLKMVVLVPDGAH